MKLKFKNQEFQTEAVNAVADLFAGQERVRSSFTVQTGDTMFGTANDLGIGNRLEIDREIIGENMHEVQRRQNLPTTELHDMDFTVEMETGTGKTYVYTKTIYELNKRYGFTKFIIVVPSVAIREGVYKSLQVTADHFGTHYDHTPSRFFIYNSKKLSDVRQFATSADIQIMIINIDAFKKEENIINQAQDKLNGESAMRYIQDTNPVVIIDEPQSVNNTPKSKEAIAALNPLCVLRYSATHKEMINLLYRLTPVDAYQMGLVKQISVSSNLAYNDHNKPFIRVVSVDSKNGYSAKIELDVAAKDGKVSRKIITARPSSELFILSGKRDLYEGYVVAGINCMEGFDGVEFTNTEFIRVGETAGGVDEDVIKRAQIWRTIETHLQKEMMLHARGIKVLSLFFIDQVKKYRIEGAEKGIYARMFEECYNELINKPRYALLKQKFDTDAPITATFRRIKKGTSKTPRATRRPTTTPITSLCGTRSCCSRSRVHCDSSFRTPR
jgi:type III restriction enzyme